MGLGGSEGARSESLVRPLLDLSPSFAPFDSIELWPLDVRALSRLLLGGVPFAGISGPLVVRLLGVASLEDAIVLVFLGDGFSVLGEKVFFVCERALFRLP